MATDTEHSSNQSAAAAAAIASDDNGGTSQPLQKTAPMHLSRRASTESSGGEGFVPILLPRSASGTSGASDASKMEALFNSKIAFPLALTHMLESVGGLGLSHIVCWQDDEASFVIKNVDAFLADVLPKFYKASESTKIRSFYRKLNRWGFSMSRKTSNNPYNIWRHPDFNRADAVKSLKEAIDTGKPIDFLNMTLRGRMRREMEASFNSQFSLGFEDDDGSSIASGHISNTSLHLLSHPRIASMPNLPMAKASSFSERKRWQFGKARTARQPQPSQQRKLSLTNYTPGAVNNPNLGGLRGTQSMQVMGQGKANASFNLLQPMGGGASNANATFDLIPPAAGASNANATFDLSLLTGAAGTNTTGILPGAMASTNGFAPSANVFALSAQELLAACNPARNNIAEGQPAFADPFAPAPPNDQAGSFGPGVTAPTATPNDNAGSFGPGITAPIVSPKPTNQSVPHQSVPNQSVPHQSIPHQNVPNQSVPNQIVHMQCDLTKEEDDELMDFFGEFAGTLPPPQEDDEEYAGEPNPLPP